MTNAANRDARRIDASPTKEFFIYMLTKDVGLMPAIIDLVDNSLDGAKRLRPGEAASYKGLMVTISAKPAQFEIHDNCGGIPVNVARDYAFRFGRAVGAPSTAHSVGQFGVGMKRALFKLGTAFVIESATKNSRFSVAVKVDEWRQQDTWDFHFGDDPKENIRVPSDEVGTRIRVKPLHASVVEEFESPRFAQILEEEIEKRHSQNILRGLEIKVNGRPLSSSEPVLLASSTLTPGMELLALSSRSTEQQTGRAKQHTEVGVKLYAGVAESTLPSDAGWYVYCNDRLVLRADQSSLTGWGEGGATKIPRFHNQFADFRGYVFFDAEDAAALPWNTTKTGVEFEHAVFRSARVRMVQMMRPVIDLLNKVKEENEVAGDGPLMRTLKTARPTKIGRLQEATFHYKPARLSTPPGNKNICYSKPAAQVNSVKRALGVTVNREVGERTFDYYYKTVCSD
jgi:hypothetical protein